jgi:hypothetical protein
METVSLSGQYYTWKYILLEKNSDSWKCRLGDCNSMIIYQHLYTTKCNFFLDRNLYIVLASDNFILLEKIVYLNFIGTTN